MEHKKIELPKFVCEWLSDISLMDDYPLGAILEAEKLRYGNREVLMWSTSNTKNQWLLIDALRYGYEPEPEPRWGIKAGNYFVSSGGYQQYRFTYLLDLAYNFDSKEEAQLDVDKLGFGEVIDLNKEGKADD